MVATESDLQKYFLERRVGDAPVDDAPLVPLGLHRLKDSGEGHIVCLDLWSCVLKEM